MLRAVLILALLLPPAGVFAADYVDLVKQGNEAYRKQDYKQALEYYHSAETDLPESPQLEYNIAGALYQQGNYEETVERYTRALNASDSALEEQAHYNLGNTYFRMADYEKAISAYQEALTLNPEDVDAKFNLELARKRLKEQIKPEQQQQQDEQQQQKQQDQQQQQDQQNQDEQQQQQDQQQQDQQESKPEEQQQKQDSQQDTEMSREDAERILNALRDDEQDLQKKIKREDSARDYQGKDW
ncbi:MAG: tetratricopeptide repeat protein [Candidatus Zixiibacteriota bacterium]